MLDLVPRHPSTKCSIIHEVQATLYHSNNRWVDHLVSSKLRYFSYFSVIPLSRYEYFGMEDAKLREFRYSVTHENFYHLSVL